MEREVVVGSITPTPMTRGIGGQGMELLACACWMEAQHPTCRNNQVGGRAREQDWPCGFKSVRWAPCPLPGCWQGDGWCDPRIQTQRHGMPIP